jgi:hypothetical protein
MSCERERQGCVSPKSPKGQKFGIHDFLKASKGQKRVVIWENADRTKKSKTRFAVDALSGELAYVIYIPERGKKCLTENRRETVFR